MTDRQYDILIIGATGYTGRLLIEYIGIHKVAPSLRLALGGRTLSKVQELASKGQNLQSIQVDVSKDESVDSAVSKARVVINLAGPYWEYGSNVVRACARHGVHYVDLTGEPYWVAKIIDQYDYLAHKNKACIIPGSGFDSIPSDVAAFLSIQTLEKKLSESGVSIPFDVKSIGAHRFKGFGLSGGTVATMFSELEQVPRHEQAKGTGWGLSPVPGGPVAPPKFLYTIPYTRPAICGGFFPMASCNEPVVRRSWGLRKVNNLTPSSSFSYHEFLATKSSIRGITMSLTWLVFGISMALIPPVRWLMKRILPSSGSGPPRDKLEQGWFEITNVSEARGVVAKSTFKGKRGDPGYFLTSWMIFESALLLLDSNNLTALGREGGILTPSTAFGNRLVEALEETGRFEASSEIIGEEESKKTR